MREREIEWESELLLFGFIALKSMEQKEIYLQNRKG